ncbi:hypothetical protein [Winogradskyella sp.]|uniref:hypothetical protein n=1 Tax=Winogradskyella sp. TaxID=1883156 RepID=UPI00260C50EF|nr:hypothetical protein [Winogradskyella sp.]
MIHVVISIDPTTAFLYGIVNNLKEKKVPLNVIEIHPSDKSYEECKEKISTVESGSVILFLGHGQENQLYGGESKEFVRKPIFKLNEMGVFKSQYLILLACDSADLLKSSFRQAKMKKSIGFGSLPTELKEIENDKMFSNSGVTQETLEAYKNVIVELVSEVIIYGHKKECLKDFIKMKEFLTLLINKKINNAILQDKNENLGDLIYQMKYQLVQY